MSLSVGASSSALSYLQSLLAQGTSSVGDAASTSGPLTALFQSLSGSAAPQASAAPSSTPGSTFGADTMAALLSLQGQPATGATAQSLFAKIDSNGDSQISQSEFESALGSAGVSTSTADMMFSQLDTNGDGTISPSELASAKRAHGHHHHAHAGGGTQGGGQSASSSLSSSSSSSSADGTTTQSTSNPDGSTTTTVTYADGSSVVTTTPVAAQMISATPDAGAGNQNSSNLLQQLIQLQAQLVSAASSTLSSFI
ncbi:MAG: EF-hand domain-containing protein [Pseudolabrys sp.]